MTREETPADGAVPPTRHVTDVRTLRALAHPVRISLLEALVLGGPMTATEAGEEIGESPTTCSFHLRQLARYGFVTEAGGGKGRARPWRVTSTGMSLASVPDDPEAEIAASALLRMIRERELDRYRDWLQSRASYPRAWQEAAGDNEYILFVTAEELADLNRELSELLSGRYLARLADPSLRPAGSAPVEVITLAFPIARPAPSRQAGPDAQTGPDGPDAQAGPDEQAAAPDEPDGPAAQAGPDGE